MKATFGRRPTLTEFYRSGASILDMRRQHGGSFQLVDEQGDLDENQRVAISNANSFFTDVETMPLTSSEPIVLLKAFDEVDGWSAPPMLEALATRSWELLARRPRLRGDIPEGFSVSDDGTSENWLRYWLSHSLTTWTGVSTAKRAAFKIDERRLRFAKAIPVAAQKAFADLVEEVVDYRLASYEARRVASDAVDARPTVVNASSVELPIVRESIAADEPVEMRCLSNDEGRLDAARHFIFATDRPTKRVLLMERAENESSIVDGDVVALRTPMMTSLATATRVGAQLRFTMLDGSAVAAGHKIIGRRLTDLDALTLQIGEQFMREAIPPLFGEVFNTGNWHAGHIPIGNGRTVLLVTLSKQGKKEDHRYHDRWSDDRRSFHWQSQRSTTPINKRGRDIIEHVAAGTSLYLFVREQKVEGGKGARFTYAGRVRYREHSGSQPMNVTFDIVDEVRG